MDFWFLADKDGLVQTCWPVNYCLILIFLLYFGIMLLLVKLYTGQEGAVESLFPKLETPFGLDVADGL
jgi:hypothetical protein